MTYYYGLPFDVGPYLPRGMLLMYHNYKHFTAKANPAFAKEDLHLSLAPDLHANLRSMDGGEKKEVITQAWFIGFGINLHRKNLCNSILKGFATTLQAT